MTATEIKPIRSKRDYEAALSEIERLWGAKVGTPEGDRLDVLATLVEAYEAEHYPIDPPDPIEAYQVPDGAAGAYAEGSGEDHRHAHPDRRGLESKARALDHDDPSPARAARHLGRSLDPTD